MGSPCPSHRTFPKDGSVLDDSPTDIDESMSGLQSWTSSASSASSFRGDRCFSPRCDPEDELSLTAAQPFFLEVTEEEPFCCGPPLQAVCMTHIAQCVSPIMADIAAFAIAAPQDWQSFCSLSFSFAEPLQYQSQTLWHGFFAERWPVFEECLSYLGGKSRSELEWYSLYKQMLDGRLECILEVFDREKKLGFAMSAMPAIVHFEAKTNGYVAKYLSASEVQPESIPCSEEHRLRFCPPSAREYLQLQQMQAATPSSDSYPYEVLEGVDGLQVGMGVEMQWKMQAGSPFGWWYGILEELQPVPDTSMFSATINFRHFPVTSKWHRLHVRFGTCETQPCSVGGFNGGIRPVSEEESQRWMQFFPKELVRF